MSELSPYSIGLIHELCAIAAKAGFTADELEKLYNLSRYEDVMHQVRQVLLSHKSIMAAPHIIDCDADPFVPKGLLVEEHEKGGQFAWDVSKVSLYLSNRQRFPSTLWPPRGHKIRDELSDQPVLNANVLDYLLANPELIPGRAWRLKKVFFWGTIYRRRLGRLYVRYLCWRHGMWTWHYLNLSAYWYEGDPAAVCTSPTSNL